jgi:hypothetical protein
MGEEQPDLPYPGPWRGAALGAVNTARIDRFLAERRLATPCVVIDLAPSVAGCTSTPDAYNGLPETLGERMQYRIRTPHDGRPCEQVILAGPTCDSMDVIYQSSNYELPLELAVGDRIDFLSAGAYSASYASVEFNGFLPIRSYCI